MKIKLDTSMRRRDRNQDEDETYGDKSRKQLNYNTVLELLV